MLTSKALLLKQYTLPLLTDEVELLLAVEGGPLEAYGPVHGYTLRAAYTGIHAVRPTVVHHGKCVGLAHTGRQAVYVRIIKSAVQTLWHRRLAWQEI